MCYSILHKKNSTQTGMFIGIIPNKTLLTDNDDIPNGVSVFVTSENTRHYLINGNWPNVQPFIIAKPFAYR